MRTLPAFIAAASTLLLSAPVAFAADGENVPVNTSQGGSASTAHAASGGSIVRTIFGLAVVLGVIYGLHWVLKRVKSAKDETSSGDALEIIATLSLGTNRALHLVRAGGEFVMIGSGEHGVTPIRRYSQDEAQSLGLIEPPVATLASLEAEVAPKGVIAQLRAKTVLK
jgi:flagellar protein FliO/FliZ